MRTFSPVSRICVFGLHEKGAYISFLNSYCAPACGTSNLPNRYWVQQTVTKNRSENKDRAEKESLKLEDLPDDTSETFIRTTFSSGTRELRVSVRCLTNKGPICKMIWKDN